MYSSTTETIDLADLYYFRQRFKNRVFAAVIARFSELVETKGLTKREIAFRLNKEPAQITRWLSGAGNWTLDTVSDLLLAMGNELDCAVSPIDLQCASGKAHPLCLDQTNCGVVYLKAGKESRPFTESNTATNSRPKTINFG